MVHPLRTEAHRAALAEIETLMPAGANTPEGDRLSVLVNLVEAWETPIEAPDPIAAIQFMEQKGLTRRDLEPVVGSRARVAEVLNRRRALTLPMIRGLSGLLDLPADVLVAAYSCAGVSRRERCAASGGDGLSVPEFGLCCRVMCDGDSGSHDPAPPPLEISLDRAYDLLKGARPWHMQGRQPPGHGSVAARPSVPRRWVSPQSLTRTQANRR